MCPHKRAVLVYIYWKNPWVESILRLEVTMEQAASRVFIHYTWSSLVDVGMTDSYKLTLSTSSWHSRNRLKGVGCDAASSVRLLPKITSDGIGRLAP